MVYVDNNNGNRRTTLPLAHVHGVISPNQHSMFALKSFHHTVQLGVSYHVIVAVGVVTEWMEHNFKQVEQVKPGDDDHTPPDEGFFLTLSQIQGLWDVVYSGWEHHYN